MGVTCRKCGAYFESDELEEEFSAKERRVLRAGKGCPHCIDDDGYVESFGSCDTSSMMRRLLFG